MTTAAKPQATPQKSATAPAPAKKPKVTDEHRAAKFQEIATRRVKKVLDDLRRLETVARSPGYKFTPDQANNLMKYIDGAVDRVRAALVARVAGRKSEVSITL